VLRPLLCAALLLMVAWPASTHGAGWTAPQRVADSAAEIALGASGVVAVAGVAADGRLLATVGSVGGLFPVAVAVGDAAPVAAPTVAVGPTGDALVGYLDGSGRMGVQARPAGSDAFVAEVAESSTSVPSVGFTAAGTGVAVWWAGRVHAAVRPRGARFHVVGPVSPDLGEQLASPPRLVTDERGSALVLWTAREGAEGVLRALRVAPDGTFGEVLTLDRAPAALDAPAAAFDAQGNAEIAYRYEQPPVSEVRVTSLAAGAEPAQVAPRILDRSQGALGAPLIGVAGQGAAVFWERWDPATRISSLRATLPDGAPVELARSAAVRVSATGLVRLGDEFLLGAWDRGARFGLWSAGHGFTALAPLADPDGPPPRLAANGHDVAALLGGRVTFWDAEPPRMQRVAIPKRARVAQRVQFSVKAADRLSPVTFDWDLGTASATSARPSRCYGRPGAQPIRLRATDGAGNVAERKGTLTIRPARRLSIGCLRLTTETVARRPRDSGTPRSVAATFVLSRRARLTVVLERRRRGGWRPAARAYYRADAGANRLPFGPRRFGGRPLRAGRYRVRVFAREIGRRGFVRASAGLRVAAR
jgi:hypothetical protein